MEIDQSFLGFEETTRRHVNPSSGGGGGYKLVPWLSWNEWDSVRNSLFSSSPLSVSSALRRITAWRSRGCLPVVIEVTASIAEIQLKDPFFRGDLGDDASDSDEMLTMMYCMAIVRLVNGVVEKTRKKTEVSIGEAADVLNIPRMLIDIRHEGSHRDLPSLRLVRLASIKALDWLKSYYWEPQKKAIPFQSAGTSDVIKEIKSRLYELAFCLNIKQARRSSSSRAKEKRIKHRERLCGRNKFLSLMAAKHQYSKSTGSMRQITKALKHLLRLYSSYSSEVVSVLIELLLKASDSSDFTKLPHDYQVSHGTYHVQSDFDDWKPVIAKLSNKEPELLLSLTKGALKMIETQEAMKHESAEGAISENAAAVSENERLSDLVEWLITNLKGLKSIPSKDSSVTEACSTDRSLPKATLLQLLRKSLLVSSHRNTQLNNSALILARMIGNSSLVEKLNKLCRLWASNPIISEENSSSVASDSVHVPQEADSIREAVEKFAFIKNLRRTKSNVLKTRQGALGNSNRWVVAKSWNSCQIGMLPHDIGSSGRLPVLDCGDNHKEVPKPIQSEEVQREEQRILNEGTRKRGSDCDVEILEKSNFKKMRENEEAYEINGEADDTMSEGVEGRLMIGGVWKKVREEELRAIASAVRILV